MIRGVMMTTIRHRAIMCLWWAHRSHFEAVIDLFTNRTVFACVGWQQWGVLAQKQRVKIGTDLQRMWKRWVLLVFRPQTHWWAAEPWGWEVKERTEVNKKERKAEDIKETEKYKLFYSPSFLSNPVRRFLLWKTKREIKKMPKLLFSIQ